MKNEKILIFGDSYSTYKGYVPERYPVYYPTESHPDVDDVSKTWWYMLASETKSEVVLNCSWSGSTICNTGYKGDCSRTSSFIYRLNQVIDSGFFTDSQVDRVFIFGGTNDSWTGNECGKIMFSDWTEADLRYILSGISFFIDKLQKFVSSDKFHFIINTELRPEVKSGIIEICNHYQIAFTELSDIDKVEGHPTYQGMSEIKRQVLDNLS